MPHGEDNAQKKPAGSWLPHGEFLFYLTFTGYLSLIASACPGAGLSRLVLPTQLKGLKCWCPGGAAAVEAFLERRTWSGHLAALLMPWHGGFSSLGVSLAYDHKTTQEEPDINHSGVSLCMGLAIYLV